VAAEGDIASLIGSLCDGEPAKRTLAAAALFEQGAESIRTVMDGWLEVPGLAHLVQRDASNGKLKLTVGVAVSPDSFERIHSSNGSPRLAKVPPDQDAREFELEFPGGVRLDILTSRDPGGDGAIARYLRKFGEGIQQVEIVTTSVDLATEELQTKFSVQPIYPATRAGADGTRVNFFLISAEGGKKVLIELVESGANSE
jgi:hypothetical protein